MKPTPHKFLSLLFCLLTLHSVAFVKKTLLPDPGNLPFDYTAPTTQTLPSVPSLTEDGAIAFNVTNIDGGSFDAFVDGTTITKTHSGTAPVTNPLRKWLEGAGLDIATIKAASVTANAISNLVIKISIFNAEANDGIEVTAKVKAGPLPVVKIAITAANADDDGSGKGSAKVQLNTFDENLKSYLASDKGRSKEIKLGKSTTTLGDILDNDSRYDKEGNRAYIVVDQNGELIDNYPVNIDQDDIIYVIIVGKKDKIQAYSADFVGTYNPVDLQMRSFVPLDSSINKSNTLTKFNPDDYDVVVKYRGPFTSANVIVKVKNNVGTGNVLATYTLNVNTLFHLGFGVAFNRTSLENPNYVLSPLSSSANTISKENGGQRNLLSVNVIWYWSSTVKYLLRGSNITRGRDVLKEANFIERINPTVGFALTGSVTDNVFAGVTFEFARGGSLVGGYHFGKVKRLLDPNFKPGETTFSGAAGDIQTTMVSKRDVFFGIILDTRILNAIFKKQ
jgi:hypothetical protein